MGRSSLRAIRHSENMCPSFCALKGHVVISEEISVQSHGSSYVIVLGSVITQMLSTRTSS
jgi:hypothetical protein